MKGETKKVSGRKKGEKEKMKSCSILYISSAIDITSP
jgi:hypothetical protein